MLSGILAADDVAKALKAGRAHDEVTDYDADWRGSDIGRDLKPVRNVKPLLSKYGLYLGVALGGFDMWTNELFGFSFFGTLPHGKPDYASIKPLNEVTPKIYGKLTAKTVFDKLSSVFVSNTNHEEDQPVASAADRPDDSRARKPAALRRAGAALLPGGRLRGGLRG